LDGLSVIPDGQLVLVQSAVSNTTGVVGPIIIREDIGIRGCFVPVGDTNLELLEGTGPNSTISIHIRERGEGLHHVCFEVDGIADKLKSLQELGINLLDKVPRKGLMGGDIGFLDPSAARGVLIDLAQHED